MISGTPEEIRAYYADRARERYHADIEAGRSRVRAQYEKHAEKRRAARRARYYANLSAERAASAARMSGRKRAPAPEIVLRARRAMKFDDRWAKWALVIVAERKR